MCVVRTVHVTSQLAGCYSYGGFTNLTRLTLYNILVSVTQREGAEMRI